MSSFHVKFVQTETNRQTDGQTDRQQHIPNISMGGHKNMDKWGYSYLIELKTLWENEKLLVTSNFFFSHNVFKSFLMLMHPNEYLSSKELIIYLNSLLCFTVYYQYCNSMPEAHTANTIKHARPIFSFNNISILLIGQ